MENSESKESASGRIQIIRRASVIALVGNAILAIAKILAGVFAGSLAVIGDGIDSSTDVLIAMIALIASRIIDKPGDINHPYGHTRAETMATLLLAFIIFFAGAQLLINTIHGMLEKTVNAMPQPIVLYITGLSIVGKLALALIQFRLGKKTGSAMLIANGKNMRNDVVISASVLIGLCFVFVFKLPIVDRIAAILVSLWVMKSSLGIFMGVNTELMDGNTDTSVYQAIFQAVRSVPGAGNPHRVRFRKLAGSIIVDLDIEVNGSRTVREAHNVARAVEHAVKHSVDGVYDVMVHVEPEGNVEEDERFGLDESKLEKGE